MRTSDIDVVVVGAGAAGLAASRALIEAGHTAMMFEARDRIGGRAWTDSDTFGVPIDRGCSFLHSGDINPLTDIAKRLGFTVIARNPDWGGSSARHILSPLEITACDHAFDWFFDQLKEHRNCKPDVPISSIFPKHWRWEAVVRAVVTFWCGVDADQISLCDVANFRDTEQNWSVKEGYGTVIAKLGEDIPVRLNAPVNGIDWSGNDVRVSVNDTVLRAKAVVITVPTTLLADETIKFTPALPVDKQEACQYLPLGINNKVFIAVDGNPFGAEPGTHILSSVSSTRISSIHLLHKGHPLVDAYLGGDYARELEQAGNEIATQIVTDELVQVFGGDVRQRLGKSVTTGWLADPWSRGAYSYAVPGHAARRTDLAAPIADRLFFAGEATSVEFYATANGAYLSGQRAASEVTAVLSR